jgi:hypothetical protein
MFVQDGQHRRAAIEQLLTDAPSLHDNTIAVMLFPDPMLDRSPAIFSALNQQYVQRNASRRVAHDPVRPLASVARRITEEALIFQGRVDYERTTIFNRALAMFTMNAVFQATQALLEVGEQAEISDEQAELALRFWTVLGEIIPEWRQVIAGETSPAALRPHFVHVHSVTLLAIGCAGATLAAAYPRDWQTKLAAWAALDWSRRNPAWEGRAMLQGRMSKKHTSIQLTANFLKLTPGVAVDRQGTGVGEGAGPLNLAEDVVVAPVQIGRVRIEDIFLGQEDRTLRQHRQKARHVTVRRQLRRQDDAVIGGDVHQPFVEGPVAQAAERQTVGGVVVARLVPGDDVRGFDRSVPTRCDDAQTAAGAAMVVGGLLPSLKIRNRHTHFQK